MYKAIVTWFTWNEVINQNNLLAVRVVLTLSKIRLINQKI